MWWMFELLIQVHWGERTQLTVQQSSFRNRTQLVPALWGDGWLAAFEGVSQRCSQIFWLYDATHHLFCAGGVNYYKAQSVYPATVAVGGQALQLCEDARDRLDCDKCNKYSLNEWLIDLLIVLTEYLVDRLLPPPVLTDSSYSLKPKDSSPSTFPTDSSSSPLPTDSSPFFLPTDSSP